jgi:hypothetical protein
MVQGVSLTQGFGQQVEECSWSSSQLFPQLSHLWDATTSDSYMNTQTNWLDTAVTAAQNDAVDRWLKNPVFPRVAALLELERAAIKRRIAAYAEELERLADRRFQEAHAKTASRVPAGDAPFRTRATSIVDKRVSVTANESKS